MFTPIDKGNHIVFTVVIWYVFQFKTNNPWLGIIPLRVMHLVPR